MNFEWDESKNEINKAKHNFSFEEATKLWADTSAFVLSAKQDKEPRKLAIGTIGTKIYSVIFVWRKNKIRIISARPSSKKEVKAYENHSKKS